MGDSMKLASDSDRTSRVPLALVLIVVALTSFAIIGMSEDANGESYEQDGIEYWVSGDAASIRGHAEGIRDVVIPSHITVDGRSVIVQTISDRAFYGCESLNSIILPETIVSIGDDAFNGCSAMVRAELPDGQSHIFFRIGESAFYGCESLTEITIPNGTHSLPKSAFGECRSMVSIELPVGLNYIYNSFNGCDSVRSLELPREYCGSLSFLNGMGGLEEVTAVDGRTGLHEMHDGAVYDIGMDTLLFIPIAMEGTLTIPEGVTSIDGENIICNELERLVIPSTVTDVGDLHYISGLEEIVVADGNTAYSTVDGALTDASGSTLILFPSGRTGDYVLPEEISHLSRFSFYYSSLESVTIDHHVTADIQVFTASFLREVTTPATVATENSFAYCRELQKVVLTDAGPVAIADGAFLSCTDLKSVTLPDSITAIGEQAFYLCTSLRSLELPSSLTAIGDGAFYTTAVASVDVPGGVSSIPARCFAGCTGLVQVSLPHGLSSIADGAFEGCSSLTIVINDSNLDIRPGDSGNGGVALHAVSVHRSGEDGSEIRVVNGDDTFLFSRDGGSYELTNFFGRGEVRLPESFTYGSDTVTNYSLDKNTFAWNGDVTSVTIPGSVRSIPSEAFKNCTSLESITLLDGVEALGWAVFTGCTSLSSVNLGSVVEVDSELFTGCTSLESVTIPRTLQNYDNLVFTGATAMKEILVEEGHPAFFSVNGVVYNNRTSELVFFPTGISGHVTIPEGTASSFSDIRGCPNMTSIYIPSTLSGIGSNSILTNCPSLERIDVHPDNDTYRSIDGVLFSADSKTLIAYPQGRDGPYTIPDGTEVIENRAFRETAGLTSIIIPGSVRTIGDEAFRGCASLESVYVGQGVDSLGFAFPYNGSLRQVVLMGDDTEVGSSTFRGCEWPITLISPREPGFIEDPEVTIIYVTMENTVTVTIVTPDGETEYEMVPGTPMYLDAQAPEGHSIVGWTPSMPAVVPSADTTYTAVCEPDTYTVTFTVDGMTYLRTDVEYGTTIPVPDSPSKTGYEFSHWKGLPDTMPAGDLTVTAVWAQTGTDGGSNEVSDDDTVSFVSDGTGSHVVSGITSSGWSTGTSWTTTLPPGISGYGDVVSVSLLPTDLPGTSYAYIFELEVRVNGTPVRDVQDLSCYLDVNIPDNVSGTRVMLVEDGHETTLSSDATADGLTFRTDRTGTVAVSYDVHFDGMSDIVLVVMAAIAVVAIAVVAVVLLRRRRRSSARTE